jgi:DTW domain
MQRNLGPHRSAAVARAAPSGGEPEPDRRGSLGPMSRPICPRCRLPLSTCLCRWITPTDNRLPLLVLQHPQEAQQAKGSARLLCLSLNRSRCAVVDTFDDTALSGLLGPAGSSLLLFPAAAAGPAITPDGATSALPRLAPTRGCSSCHAGAWPRRQRRATRSGTRTDRTSGPRWRRPAWHWENWKADRLTMSGC